MTIDQNDYQDPRCKEANIKWNQTYADVPCTNRSSKVHFPSEHADLVHVHHMIDWSDAYQAARKGPWEQYARDRVRFQRRIAEVEKAISHVLVDHLLKAKD